MPRQGFWRQWEARWLTAERVANFLRVSTEELKDFARLTGHADVHALSVRDLCTVNSKISRYTAIRHV